MHPTGYPSPVLLRTPRVAWMSAAVLTIAAGLASRGPLSPWLPSAAGDTLYATLIYCLAGVCFPTWTPVRRGGSALLFCVAIEISQAFHPPWLDALRAHRLAALVLGRGFLWSDLGWYAVGTGVPLGLETLGRRRAR